MEQFVPNHIVSTRVEDFPPECRKFSDLLRGRSILARKAAPLPIECVARGYLSGSAWIEYKRSGTICGIPLSKGLTESAKLPDPLFTPATKEESGHDENIDFDRASGIVGRETALEAKKLTLDIYRHACTIAEEKGLMIADTKMEFGRLDERLILIDELLTPDSSRFWSLAGYSPGRPQES